MIGWIKYLRGCAWSKESDVFDSCQVLSQKNNKYFLYLESRKMRNLCPQTL